MRHLDLFSGIGGFSLGLERAGFETIAFCEIDDYCQRVLHKHWPTVPVYDDVRELTGNEFTDVAVLTAGYPCQPFSVAGKRKGEGDDRHLWPEVARLIRAIGPRWFIGENVAGHISMGLDEVLSDLEGLGYTAETFVIPAVAVDAPHRRDRVWIVAHAGRERLEEREGMGPGGAEGARAHAAVEAHRGTASDAEGLRRGKEHSHPGGGVKRNQAQGWAAGPSAGPRTPADAMRRGLEHCRPEPEYADTWQALSAAGRLWPPEPGVGRVADGIPRRVDRLRALGNAVVPQIPEMIGLAIQALEEN